MVVRKVSLLVSLMAAQKVALLELSMVASTATYLAVWMVGLKVASMVEKKV